MRGDGEDGGVVSEVATVSSSLLTILTSARIGSFNLAIIVPAQGVFENCLGPQGVLVSGRPLTLYLANQRVSGQWQITDS